MVLYTMNNILIVATQPNTQGSTGQTLSNVHLKERLYFNVKLLTGIERSHFSPSAEARADRVMQFMWRLFVRETRSVLNLLN